MRRGRRDSETYVNYLDNLEEIRDHVPDLSTLAQVDMALWVLFERVDGSFPDERIRESFENDLFLQGLRMRNMAHLLDLTDVRLARSLLTVNMRLAAQLAGFCFEQKVRRLYQKVFSGPIKDKDLNDLIARLGESGAIDNVQWGMWKLLKEVRNDAIHSPESLTEKSVGELIREIERETRIF